MDAARLWLFSLLLSLASCACAEWNDSLLMNCVRICETVGCVRSSCLPSCSYLNSTAANYGSEQPVSPALLKKWEERDCNSECHYHCTLLKETEEAGFTQEAIGYRDDWCLIRSVDRHEKSKRLFVHILKTGFTRGISLADIKISPLRTWCVSADFSAQNVVLISIRHGLTTKFSMPIAILQEPASAAFSAINIIGNLIGLSLFLRNSFRKRQNVQNLYSYTDLWTGFGLLSILYWVSRYVLHSREMAFDKHLESSLEFSLSLYGLCLAIMRIGRMRTEAARVIVAAPTIAFLYTHLMYINFCFYDYGLNVQFCLGLVFAQYLLWITWAVWIRHPGRYLLLLGGLNASLALFIRLSDFDPKWPSLNSEAEALWIASTIPLTFIWWSFAVMDTMCQQAQSRYKKATGGSESKKIR